MGTGGGGTAEQGISLLEESWKKGVRLRLTSPDDIPDDAWICTGSYLGSIAPRGAEESELCAGLGLERKIEREIVSAIRELMSYKGCQIFAVAPVELGGLNTPAALDAAANLSITAIDGDFAGRAVPETVQFRFCVAGMKIWPRVLCDYAGNVTIIKEALNPPMMERIQKHVAMSSFGLVGAAGHLMQGKDMKKVIIGNSISRCLSIGRGIRNAGEKGETFSQEVAAIVDGWVLFEGKVTGKDWENKDGYMIGYLELEGEKLFKGHILRIWFKNEFHISWKDGKPFVTSPDLISVVDLDSHKAPTNTDIAPGSRLGVIGMKANDWYRRGRGLEVLSPSHFGFAIKYVPIEERIRENNP